MNTGIFWSLIVMFSLTALAHISLIGKERKPITPQVAVVNVLSYGCIIVAMLLDRAGF